MRSAQAKSLMWRSRVSDGELLVHFIQAIAASAATGDDRAHGLIKKIPRTHRYLLTAEGRTAIAALLAARQASPRRLTAA
jgi:hypothetical protein